MENYQYQPLAEACSFRLLRIRRDETDGIHVDIETVTISDRPLYYALSYTWGCPFSSNNFELEDPGKSAEVNARYSSECNVPILCNGRVLHITQNLSDALDHLKRLVISVDDDVPLGNGEKTHHYWIDAICINQGDLDERAAQVSMMYDIYASAEIVYIWLGPMLPRTQKALGLITYIAELPDEKRDLMAKYPPNVLAEPGSSRSREIGLRPTTHQDWETLYAFLNRSWFHRAWVVQEFVAAPRHRMWCGHTRVYWAHTLVVSKLIAHTRWHDFFAAIPYWHDVRQVPISTQYQTPGASPFQMSLFKFVIDKNWSDDATFSASSLFQSSRSFQATDPRDMVYSSFYLVRKLRALNPGLEGIIPDYRKPVEQVYVDLAYFLICADKNLHCLTSVVDPARRNRTHLPSWVMDLSCQLYPTPLSDAWLSSDAAKGLAFSTPALVEGRQLVVTGVHVDTIIDGSMEYCNWDEGQLNSWLALAMKLPHPYQNGQPILEVLWRTLITDEAGGESPADGSHADHFLDFILCEMYDILNIAETQQYHKFPDTYDHTENFQHTLDSMLAAMFVDPETLNLGPDAFLHLMNHVAENPRGVRYHDETMKSKDLYTAAMRDKISSRRLFLTKGSLLGMASESFEINDTIWILAGSDVPFVLRSLSDGCYMVVGDAYVHGIMQGEALRSGKFEQERIVLA